jgi:hypothetical protein
MTHAMRVPTRLAGTAVSHLGARVVGGEGAGGRPGLKPPAGPRDEVSAATRLSDQSSWPRLLEGPLDEVLQADVRMPLEMPGGGPLRLWLAGKVLRQVGGLDLG